MVLIRSLALVIVEVLKRASNGFEPRVARCATCGEVKSWIGDDPSASAVFASVECRCDAS